VSKGAAAQGSGSVCKIVGIAFDEQISPITANRPVPYESYKSFKKFQSLKTL